MVVTERDFGKITFEELKTSFHMIFLRVIEIFDYSFKKIAFITWSYREEIILNFAFEQFLNMFIRFFGHNLIVLLRKLRIS